MSPIWARRGDWYSMEYTLGDDPKMLYAKYKLTNVTSGLIEGRIIALLADKHKCEIGDIKPYGYIMPSDS